MQKLKNNFPKVCIYWYDAHDALDTGWHEFDEIEKKVTSYPDSLLNTPVESITLQSLGYAKDFPINNIVHCLSSLNNSLPVISNCVPDTVID